MRSSSKENMIHVRLFGTLELKNSSGEVLEERGKETFPFRFLKALLIEPTQELYLEKALPTSWTKDATESDILNAARVYLHRAKNALRPLQLDSAGGFINYLNGKCSLNPTLTLHRDIDEFTALMQLIRECAPADPHGLQLCMDALELYRGPLLENTKDASWLDEHRSYYHAEFCRLAEETLSRSKALNMNDAIPLLCQRAIAITPDTELLHKDIMDYLSEQNMGRELMQHVQCLAHSGKADWLDTKQAFGFLDPKLSQQTLNSKYIHVKLFGNLEFSNQRGRMVEILAPENIPLLMLKYLLLYPNQSLLPEVGVQMWPARKPGASTEGTVCQRVRRMGNALRPLYLNGKHGLLLEQNGTVSLNSAYTLERDVDLFAELMKQIGQTAASDPKGLRLCVKALALYDGPLLEYTQNAPWLEEHRRHYHTQFISLVHDTLNRIKTLNTEEGLLQLCHRAGTLLPEDQTLQEEILQYLSQRNHDLRIVGHIARLKATGKAEWMKNNTIVSSLQTKPSKKQVQKPLYTPPLPQAPIPKIEDDKTLYATLFGAFTLSNKEKQIEENRRYSSHPYLLLKYLVINQSRESTWDELVLHLWPEALNGQKESTAPRVYLHRAKAALRPLNLDGAKNGLIYASEGKRGLNPDYTIKRDIDIFAELMEQISQYASDDPTGLKLCMDALVLYRGPFLEYTTDVPWAGEYRAHYRSEFCRLAKNVTQKQSLEYRRCDPSIVSACCRYRAEIVSLGKIDMCAMEPK